MAVASLVLGILAIISTIVGMLATVIPYVGTVFSFAAPVLCLAGLIVGGLGLSQAKREQRSTSLAVAGVVVSAVALVPAFVVALTCGLCNACASTAPRGQGGAPFDDPYNDPWNLPAAPTPDPSLEPAPDADPDEPAPEAPEGAPPPAFPPPAIDVPPTEPERSTE